ncbi:MAG: recombination mediator RecR [Bacteroidales bacterium]|nr:recombination mediator RecR [Bacteroidales bacterium]
MYSSEKYPSQVLQEAVEAIGSLPGVGSRSALRLALHLLGQPAESVHRFADALRRLADDVHYCHICQMIADSDTCTICADHTRDARTICVVESVRDVMSIEATGQYRGVYHVLGGIISPIDGVGPSDLHIKELIARIEGVEDPTGIEVILALSGDVEGETTSLYLYRQIEGLGVKVTTLARGLGFGDDLEYADALTLGRSLVGRQPFKP